jgi:hypothetical protein
MQPSAPSSLKIGTAYAEMVIGSLKDGCARYILNGTPVDIDVTIPPDLAESWWWNGSLLRWQRSGRVGISICADTFGVEACFERARWFMAQDATHEAAVVQERMF